MLDDNFRDQVKELFLKYALDCEVAGIPPEEFKNKVFNVLLGIFLSNNEIGTDGLDRIQKTSQFKENIIQFHNYACELFTKTLD